ncbi:uncharacterized protein PAC_11010 [Phialocephala subalpina]|uniref:Uncharacterized protein n=1 Tax=Phialocephala subalpina TaxID=576137 RepID=A0A1L7X7W7_9HELO|nr:uncharacterized protein PAC_11010 [Phialocephala subalpina]
MYLLQSTPLKTKLAFPEAPLFETQDPKVADVVPPPDKSRVIPGLPPDLQPIVELSSLSQSIESCHLRQCEDALCPVDEIIKALLGNDAWREANGFIGMMVEVIITRIKPSLLQSRGRNTSRQEQWFHWRIWAAQRRRLVPQRFVDEEYEGHVLEDLDAPVELSTQNENPALDAMVNDLLTEDDGDNINEFTSS